MQLRSHVRELRARRVWGLPLPDVALAVAVAAASMVQLPLTGPMENERDSDALAMVLALVIAGALAWRRVRPALSCTASVVASGAEYALGYQTSLADPFGIVSLYSVGAYSPPAAAVAVSAGAVVTTWVGVWVDDVLVDQEPWRETVFTALGAFLACVPAGIGYVVRGRRARRVELVAQVTRQERLARLEADHALAEERDRIARELHDVIAHHVSGIVLQAGAAHRHPDPEQLPDALLRIRESGTSALAAMRDVLGLLRSDAEPAAPRSPAPTLADLPALVDGTREHGLRVDLAVSGMPRPLLDHLELCAYRVVQEALTNAVRHAAGARVTVRVHYDAHAVDLQIRNSREAAASPPRAHVGSGLGLVGMRERVVAAGGHLQTGPTSDGWVVHATIPAPALPEDYR